MQYKYFLKTQTKCQTFYLFFLILYEKIELFVLQQKCLDQARTKKVEFFRFIHTRPNRGSIPCSLFLCLSFCFLECVWTLSYCGYHIVCVFYFFFYLNFLLKDYWREFFMHFQEIIPGNHLPSSIIKLYNSLKKEYIFG